jgi:hypothetical protein
MSRLVRAAVVAAMCWGAVAALPAQADTYRIVFGSYTGSLASGVERPTADAGCLMCVSFVPRRGERSARIYVQDASRIAVPFMVRGSNHAAACTEMTIPVRPGVTYTVVPFTGTAGQGGCVGSPSNGTVTVMVHR